MQGAASQQNTAMQLVRSFCECLMHCGIAMEPFAYPSFAAVRAREKTAEDQDLVVSLLRRLTELLLERETITSVDMEAICGKRKGRSPTNYSNIIRDMEKKEKEKEKEEKKEEVKEVKEEKKETTNTDTTGTTSAYSV